MPRKRKPPRLYLRERAGRESQWVILDGAREVGTGRVAGDLAGAEKALERHIAGKYTPPVTSQVRDLLVTEVLTYYAKERMPKTARPDAIRVSLAPLIGFWAGKTISEIKGQTCRDYVGWRQKWSEVAESTARHDLVNLRAALGFYHAEHTLDAMPVVTLPDKSPPRERWLDRGEIARLLWAAWREPRFRHVARFVLIGFYTGTRSTAVLQLRWMPSTEGGWFDLEAGRLYRKGLAKKATKKRQTPAKIHSRLLPHLYRWREADAARGLTHVITYNGKPVEKLRRSWAAVRKRAGLDDDEVVQHTLRHSAATWLMQAGVSIFEAAGYLGMSPETLERVYGHQHSDFQGAAASALPPKKRPRNEPFQVIEGGTNRVKKR
ncbi:MULTISPECIES: site-specific integrase [Rhodomicrobium]|uniref:site-specific integrase n=1 Tax=Rhodomicrobium TaxID=1068 RepID=UPI000B4B8211|nr:MULTISPECIES: site-specific integrase [Rhodomicrobium]